MSLKEIDDEIRKLTKRIEAIQKETIRLPHGDGSDEISRSAPPKPDYSTLPSLKNIECPKGFERAPITCEPDPGKAERIAAKEASLRELLLAKNREDHLALIRKIQRHQSRNPLGKFSPLETTKPDLLRDRMINQWIT